jgi:hypothetical protein
MTSPRTSKKKSAPEPRDEEPVKDYWFLVEAGFFMTSMCMVFLTVILMRVVFFPPVCTNGPLLLQQIEPSTQLPKVKHSGEIKAVRRPGE